MKTYNMKILMQDKKIYESEVVSVTACCKNGQLSVLAGHEPMIANLTEGPLTVRTKEATMEATAGHGMLLVGREVTAVMVHSFVWTGDDTKEPVTQATAPDIQELL